MPRESCFRATRTTRRCTTVACPRTVHCNLVTSTVAPTRHDLRPLGTTCRNGIIANTIAQAGLSRSCDCRTNELATDTFAEKIKAGMERKRNDGIISMDQRLTHPDIVLRFHFGLYYVFPVWNKIWKILTVRNSTIIITSNCQVNESFTHHQCHQRNMRDHEEYF